MSVEDDERRIDQIGRFDRWLIYGNNIDAGIPEEFRAEYLRMAGLTEHQCPVCKGDGMQSATEVCDICVSRGKIVDKEHHTWLTRLTDWLSNLLRLR